MNTGRTCIIKSKFPMFISHFFFLCFGIDFIEESSCWLCAGCGLAWILWASSFKSVMAFVMSSPISLNFAYLLTKSVGTSFNSVYRDISLVTSVYDDSTLFQSTTDVSRSISDFPVDVPIEVFRLVFDGMVLLESVNTMHIWISHKNTRFVRYCPSFGYIVTSRCSAACLRQKRAQFGEKKEHSWNVCNAFDFHHSSYRSTYHRCTVYSLLTLTHTYC